MDYSRPELADRLAAEYVSGLLRGPARRRFDTLLPAHPALRAAVRAWHDRLMPLTSVVTPQPPSPLVWQRIEARLHGGPTVSPRSAAEPVGWWRQLAFWRAVSAISGVAVLGLALMLANPAPAAPPIVVVMSPIAPAPGTSGGPAGGIIQTSIVASISGDQRAVVTRPLAGVDVGAGRVLELWAAAGTGAPRSLGVISHRDPSVVRRASLPEGTDHLAVSLEPTGGSPTGAPTGPVLFVGKLPPS